MLINKASVARLFCVIALVLWGQILFAGEKTKLVILHTNDTHSQVEPTEESARFPNMGGYARRMGIIDKIRKEEVNVLLVDAGDYWQGSPYFNFFNGRIEIDAMNRMKYDAATLGNHEFDNGVDTLAVVLSEANFPVLSSNYEVSGSDLSNILKPYIIIEKNGIKIGLFALGVEPKGLIMASNYRGVIYKDPVQTAVNMSSFLKKEKCDIIICLSHLGTKENMVNDFDIARATKYVDVIVGGHSHELIENRTEANADGKPVVVAQMGKSGLYLGRIDIWLEK